MSSAGSTPLLTPNYTPVGTPTHTPVGTPLQGKDRKGKKLTRQETLDRAFNTELALTQTRRWIEECTGCVEEDKSYREYLQDGIILCRLVQIIDPQLIRKVNLVRSPFAWRENIGFFLEACEKLGLKRSQLFSPEDLSNPSVPNRPNIRRKAAGDRRLRNVAETIYWLGRVVQDLPGYCGPVLELDLSFPGDLEPAGKSPNPKPTCNGIDPPDFPVSFITATPPLHPKLTSRPSSDSPNHNPIHSSPSVSHDPPSEPRRERRKSSKSSPKIKVKKVRSVETTTDKQLFAQIVLYLGNTARKSSSLKDKERNNYVTSAVLESPQGSRPQEDRSAPVEEGPSIDQQAKSDKRLSQFVELADQLEQIERGRTSEESTSRENEHRERSPEVAERDDFQPVSEAPEKCVEAEFEESAQPAFFPLVNGLDYSQLAQSRDVSSPTGSTATHSEVSTVVARELSSRCSGSFCGSDGEDEAGNTSSAVSKAEHFDGDESASFGNPNKLVFTDNPLSPANLLSDPQEQLQSLQYSPAQLSNPTGVPTLDSTGLFPLESRGSGSQGTASIPYLSPRYTDTTFHFDLSQSQASQPEELGFDNSRNSAKNGSNSSFVESILSLVVAPPVGFGGYQSLEQGGRHLQSGASNPRLANGYRNAAKPRGQTTESNRSSTCSVDSTTNSVIVVSYSSDCVGEKVSDVQPTPTPSDPGYAVGEDSTHPTVVESLQSRGVASVSESFPVTDAELEKGLEMAGTSEVLTMVPHHSLNISSTTGHSPPDAPSSPPHLSHGFVSMPRGAPQRVSRTLYVVPSGSDQKIKVTDVFGESPHKEGTKGGFKDMKVSVVMLPGEKRLGFNVVGGQDQGANLRVEAIAGSSPASRSSLQCGDELLAVDNIPLTNLIHREAKNILHKAASRGKIVLHVRRYLHPPHPHPHPHKRPKEREKEEIIGPTITTIVDEPSHQQGGKRRSVDMSRVKSDALPHSLMPKMITYEPPGRDARGRAGEEPARRTLDVPDFLSDSNSLAVEIGSSMDAESISEKLSFTGSHRSVNSLGNEVSSSSKEGGAARTEDSSLLASGNTDDVSSIMDSVMAVARRHSESLVRSGSDSPDVPPAESPARTARPISAPAKGHSVSAGAMPPGGVALPSNWSGPEVRKVVVQRKESREDERERRKVTIEEGAVAAMKYTTKQNKHKKTDSLPSHFRSSGLSAFASGDEQEEEEEEEDINGLPSAHTRTASLPAEAVRPTSIASTSSASSSTPLNLMNVTLTETREASVSQMDEIWKEVESAGQGGVAGEGLSASGGSGQLAKGDSSILKEQEEGDIDEVPVFEELAASTLPPTTSTPIHPAPPTFASSSASPQKVAGNHSHVAMETTKSPLHEGPGTPSKHARSLPRGIESLLTSLRTLNETVGTHEEEEEFKMLEEMLQSNTFKKAKESHDAMRILLDDEDPEAPTPVLKRAMPNAKAVRHHFHHRGDPDDNHVSELRQLLRDPHIQSVLVCHDKVATRDLYFPASQFPRVTQDPADVILSESSYNLFSPSSSAINPFSRDMPSNRKEMASIVFLERTNRPLGCTIYKQDDAVFIGRILKGCDAEQSEVLREGDELLEVDGIPLTGRSTDEIVRLMSGEPGSTLALTIIPVHDDIIDQEEYEPKFIRAHFNYNGRLDEEIPCKALGLTFQKGDIMEISNQDDPNWWQARKLFDEGAQSLPGLIPARHLQQKREALVRSYPLSPMLRDKYRRKGIRSMFTKKRKKKIFYQQSAHGGAVTVGDEVVTYEDVVKVDPLDMDWRRPILLIGAPGVGRRTLIKKLLNYDPSRYAPVIQHTTRPIRPGEVHGHDYYFVTREEFDQNMRQDQYLEYGELRGHCYGTAFSSIKKVVEGGRVPVLDLHPQALKLVRHSGLKPYIVFIASPRLERLRITRRLGSERQKKRLGSFTSPLEPEEAHIYTEVDLQRLVEESYLIENQYGHYFDWVIVNDDFHVASDMLKEIARRLDDEPQWVPSNWLEEQ